MVPQIHMYIIQLKQTLRSICFIALAWWTMLILQNKGFYEFVLTMLPRSLFNTWFVVLCFFLKIVYSIDSLILHSCILGNFASVFGCSQLNRPCQSLKCSVASNTSHFPALLSSSCSIDWVSKHFFCFSNVLPPTITT